MPSRGGERRAKLVVLHARRINLARFSHPCYAFARLEAVLVTQFLIGLAQAAPAGGGGGLLSTPLVPMVIIVGIFYFLLIRPNAKKQKELQKMLSELKKGDDVSTQGGIIGKITGLKDNEVTLQVQEGVRIRFLRSAITGVYSGDAPKTDKSEKSEAKAS